MSKRQLFEGYITVKKSPPLSGTVMVNGAKNAVLVTMASLILAQGKSRLTNVPHSADVLNMITVLESLGALVEYNPEAHRITVDSTQLSSDTISAEMMNSMRASSLVMGPLLARLGRAVVTAPGGCMIGKRPIDYHLKNFKRMGVSISEKVDCITLECDQINAGRIVLEYPSVGATENIMMAATLTRGTTTIVDAALEPEVLDLITVLKKMGAQIEVCAPAQIRITGVEALQSVEHEVMPDRLEVGSLALAAVVTGGSITIPNARPYDLDVFLYKLEEMGHTVTCGENGVGLTITACAHPEAVSFKTGPYPGFPTDLQAPMMVAQCLALGESVIEETVFENRMVHTQELVAMGADISVHGTRARVVGGMPLSGASVHGKDIRGTCALVLAGLAAEGETLVTGIQHIRRGYAQLDEQLRQLGADITYHDQPYDMAATSIVREVQ